jgi:potassium uptake TrkH family protein
MIILDLKRRLAKSEKMDLIGKFINRIFLMFTLVLFILSVYDIGFSPVREVETLYQNLIFRVIFPATGILFLIRSLLFTDHKMNWKVFFTNIFLGVLIVLVFLYRLIFGETIIFQPLFHHFTLFHFLAFTLLILEISRLKIEKAIGYLNPAQLFIVSFGFIILAGTFMLLMPESTTEAISFTDAFFTSTSAVCVTGLTVVDTATRYTALGKLIIMGLIQVGGIGVVTITSFFGFFFKETSSFREQLMLRDYLSEDSLSGILKTLVKVILITISIELVGAALLFYSMYLHGEISFFENLKFSVFHSVSAFCNAGFSTFTDNLYDISVRQNYFLHYVISGLIILGGLGYPVFLNLYSYAKAQTNWFREFLKFRKPYVHRVGMITFNTKIVVGTTLLLLLLGTFAFYFFEYNVTQKDAGSTGARIAMSWFLSVTPRTAGFNTVNMEQLALPTILIMIFLMWVGASPVSTGGGVKTSTFTIALLNVIRIMKGKNHIEILKREIHEFSVNKAFTIIFVSLVCIGLGTFLIVLFDGHLGLLRIVFECFSAFGTVGLSLNLTPFLSDASKWVLILLMFFGRMGIMTLLLALTRQAAKSAAYRYPKENLIIT